jgi:hypothetical protein
MIKAKYKLQFTNIKLSYLLGYALLFSAISYIFVYIWIACHRLQYPFELEWLEGGMVDQVQRIVNGRGVYIAPSIDFVPFLYPPLYFYLSALASKVLGGGLYPLRIVSFISSLFSFTTIFLIVRAETKNWWAAIMAVGLFAATFRLTGAWLDIARVDSLFITLYLLLIFVVGRKKTLANALLAGALAALAFLSKQTALIACLPIIAYLIWHDWKYGLALLFSAVAIIGITTMVLDKASTGWYSYYIFGLLSAQTQWVLSLIQGFWYDDIFVHLPIAILFVLFFFVGSQNQDRSNHFLWFSILVGALAGTFFTRVKIGGYDNVLLPLYAVISILFGVGLNELLIITNRLQTDYRNRIETMVYIVCLIQLGILHYNLNAQIPTNSDLKAGNQFVKLISEVKGEVYLPDHGYLSSLAGKKTYAQQSAIWDVLRGNQQSIAYPLLTEDLNNAIQNQKFDMIIFDSDWNACCTDIDKYYLKTGEVFEKGTSFYPVTGWHRQPTYIYIARRITN